MNLSRRKMLLAPLAIPLLTAAQQRLADLAARHNILLGVGASVSTLQTDMASADLMAQQCAMMVNGLDLKWRWSEPTQGNFDFSGGDALYHFATSHNMLYRGHCLVWHQSLPDWVNDQFDRPTALAILQSHISHVVGHYKGHMQSWDVVNEALNPEDELPRGMRNNLWWRMIGDDYIDQCFQFAHAADPAAKLCLNEYGMEYDTPQSAVRRARMLDLLGRLKANNIPVHALGIQAHLNPGTAPFSADGLRSFIRDVGALGLEVWLTEFDVIDRHLPADIATRDQTAADAVAEFLGAALAEPNVRMIVLGGITDRNSWINNDPYDQRLDGLAARPDAWDDQLRPKPMLAAIQNALMNRPG